MAPGFPCPLPPEEKGSRSLVSRAHSRFVNSYQRASEPTVPTNLCFPGRRAIRLHLQGAFGSLRFGTLRIPKRFPSGSLTSAWGIRTGVKANLGSLPEARKRAENFLDQIRVWSADILVRCRRTSTSEAQLIAISAAGSDVRCCGRKVRVSEECPLSGPSAACGLRCRGVIARTQHRGRSHRIFVALLTLWPHNFAIDWRLPFECGTIRVRAAVATYLVARVTYAFPSVLTDRETSRKVQKTP